MVQDSVRLERIVTQAFSVERFVLRGSNRERVVLTATGETSARHWIGAGSGGGHGRIIRRPSRPAGAGFDGPETSYRDMGLSTLTGLG
jgi:hypothetical protein